MDVFCIGFVTDSHYQFTCSPNIEKLEVQHSVTNNNDLKINRFILNFNSKENLPFGKIGFS